MTDLEDRVRHTLHVMAGAVPPSEGARTGFARRVAARRRARRSALVAAAAAVVVAGVAVPVALNQDTAHTAGPATTAPPPGTRAQPPAGTEADPWVITRFTEGGTGKAAVFWVTAGAGRRACMALRPADGAREPDCTPLPETWPTGPGPGTNVLTRGVLSSHIEQTGPAPLRNWLVFTTAPGVTRLEVRAGDGTPVPAAGGFGTTGGVTFRFYDFGGPPWGFGYTAYDARGEVVESAIT